MLLEVEGLHVTLGESVVLDGTALAVRPGEMLGLVGPNGAGKSTLFAVIFGFIRAGAGRIRFMGEDISAWSVVRRARAGLARTFQVPRAFRTLTVRENLAVALPNEAGESIWRPVLRPSLVAAREHAIGSAVEGAIALCDLGAVAHMPAASLSGGQQKLLEIGRASMSRPMLLLLDEPFNGVNPVMIERLTEVIRRLNEAGTTVLIIEHNLQALCRLVGRIYVLDRGATLAEGAPAKVLAEPAVQAAYLGRSAHA